MMLETMQMNLSGCLSGRGVGGKIRLWHAADRPGIVVGYMGPGVDATRVFPLDYERGSMAERYRFLEEALGWLTEVGGSGLSLDMSAPPPATPDPRDA